MTALALLAICIASADPAPAPQVIVVTGAQGNEEFGEMFSQWATRWEESSKQAGARFQHIGSMAKGEQADREILREQLESVDAKATSTLWLVLIGHGTFDGRQAKFNLRGPDVSAEELAGWLEPIDIPLAVINCTSSSSPFINRLSGENRVIVTATKSGTELNFARFGDYISQAIADESADLDKDQQTSLLEAFLAASSSVAEFYQTDARLATEHALLDDNGDGLGTSADWFRGYRAVRSAAEGSSPDGQLANSFFLLTRSEETNLPDETRKRRSELESQIEDLRRRKEQLNEAEYYRQLEALFVDLAHLYSELEEPTAVSPESVDSVDAKN